MGHGDKTVLVKAGEMVRALEMMYKVVVQTVLLYRSESWIVTDAMMKLLEGFNHQILRRLLGKTTWSIRGEGWEWPLVEEALETTGLWPI